MSRTKVKLPSVKIRSNKKKKTLHIGTKSYYDHLPDNLTPETVDEVHEWDDIYLAGCLQSAAKSAKKFKHGEATLTVELPTANCTAMFSDEADPLVVVKTDYGSDTQVGKVLANLQKMANQKVN